MNEIKKLKEAINWFENSICDEHDANECPDCRNNRVALQALQEKLDREESPDGWIKPVRCKDCRWTEISRGRLLCNQFNQVQATLESNYCCYGEPKEERQSKPKGDK